MKTSFSLLLLVIALLSAPLTHGQVIYPTKGLIAYYPFNGNAKDESGNGHDGTVTSAELTTDRFGSPNAAYAFDGTSSVITVPHSDVLNLTNTDFTIALWAVLNAPQTVSPQFYLVSKDDGPTKWIFGYGGTLQFPSTRTIYFMKGVSPESVWYADGRAYSAPSNSWHHYVIRKDLNGYTTYIDGQRFKSEPNSVEPFHGNTAPLTIGRAENLSVSGKLDDIYIYNRALTSIELQWVVATGVGSNIALTKAVKPLFTNLLLGTNYQLQVSGDCLFWSNEGAPFTATNATMIYPQYWDVAYWNDLYFRLVVSP